MRKKYKITAIVVLILAVLSLSVWYLHRTNIAVLDPKGPIALQERNLIYTALLLSLIVVIPVYTLAIVFAWRYREGNKKAKYSPDLDGNKIAETIWWVVPSIIILILAVITWRSTHSLDPYKPIASKNPQLTIQVIALDWKWLFIYPGENVASVNFLQFPKDTPLDFEITSDSVMNSFWIPQLGGQIYAMPGMSTQLHLMATSFGDFNGSSANISGEGFAGMTFIARASTAASFASWINSAKHSKSQLNSSEYSELLQPSEYNAPSYYSSVKDNLYGTIIDKYLGPSDQMSGMDSNAGTGYTTSAQSMDMMQ